MQEALENLRTHLRPGHVYRRQDLLPWSKSVDRHLQILVQNNELRKLRAGLYYRPEGSTFGSVPPTDEALVQAFLKDDRFLLVSPNAYNALRVGTTQLYTTILVYNHKRHGNFKLGNRTFDFRMKHHFPLKLTEEFLLVDLINNLEELAEDQDEILGRVRQKVKQMNVKRLLKTAKQYGTLRAKRFFEEIQVQDVH